MNKVKSVLLCIFCITVSNFCFGQKYTESEHPTTGSWGGTGQVCNVCHEPFNAKYAIKQVPYWNHQVNAPTFSGNKLDGSPVLIKTEKGSDNCLSCHKREKEPNSSTGKLSKSESEAIQSILND